MSWQNFVLEVLKEGREYIHVMMPVVTAVVAWHFPQPKYMNKKDSEQ